MNRLNKKNEENKITDKVIGLEKKEVLNFKEALELLGISSSMLYKLTSSKNINHYKPSGKLIFFKRSDILDWMLSNKQASNEEIQDEIMNNLKQRKHG